MENRQQGRLPDVSEASPAFKLIRLPICKKYSTPYGVLYFLEQDTGVEPAFTAWEAVVLPIYESCMWLYYSKGRGKKQPFFVESFLLQGRHKSLPCDANQNVEKTYGENGVGNC